MRAPLLFIYLGAARSAQVTRCCGPGFSLLLTPSPHCAPASTESRSLPSVSGLDVSGDRREVQVALEDEGLGLPSCGQGFQVHTLGQGQEDVEGWVTTDGQLVTAKYEAEFPHGEFCVDYDSTSSVVVAVMCDPCKGQLTCLSLCCPHGQAMVDGPDFSLVCQEQPGGVSYSPQVWDKHEEKMLNWERNQHYILVAPPKMKKGSNATEGFQCPQNKKDSLTRLWAEQDQGQYRVQGDGSLLGIGLPDYISDPGGLATKNESWSAGEFCLVVGSPPDYSSYDYTGEEGDQDQELAEGGQQGLELVETFMTCYDTDPYNWCTEFTTVFHPTGLCISILFLLLTLAAYLLEPSLRDQLMGKMTIIFISNLTICFTVAVLSWFQVSEHGTGGCAASGYLIQYFFLAFFFWLNSLAWHIYLPFSSLSLAARIHRATERTRLFLCCLYAQGTPLLVCAITALVDASRQDLSQAQRLYYPNMGVYRCFLGAQRTHPTRSYFVQPDFIYFHSVLLLLQISNLCLLAASLRHLCSHSGGDLRQKMHDNVGRFVKFFVILGFYWTGDFLSTALAAEYGEVKTCGWRIVADLGGLFSGVLIFVVLVCNKPVLTSILHRAKGLKPGSEEQQEMEETRMLRDDTVARSARTGLSSSG